MAIGWDLPGRLDAAWRDGLLGPGQVFELVDEEVLGSTVPVFSQRPRSLVDVLTTAAETHGDRPFLIGVDETVTFAEAPGRVGAIARHLADEHGVRAGDRVALAGGVSVEHCLALWAVVGLGAIATTMNPAWTAAEVDHALGVARPRLAIADAGGTGTIDRGAGPVVRFSSLPAGSEALPHHRADEDDPFAVVFTSGTTGRPKGATLSHRNAIHFSLAAAATSAVHHIVHEVPSLRAPVPRVIASAPLFHVSGLLGQLTNASFWGMTLVVPPPGRWDETTHLQLTERHRVTSWSIVPTQLWRLVEHPELDRYDLTSLEMIGGGGAAFDPELLRRTSERLPGVSAALRVGYGMTETAGSLSILQPPCTDEQRSSVGTPVAGATIEIRGPAGTPLPDGEIGEIWGRSAQVFLGYWDDPDATAEVLDADRWYATGDFGRICDGYLHLESRLRDLIIRGGENIYPIEIENRLMAHPAIAEAAVLGAPHAVLGEEVRAVVVVRDGTELTTDDVRSWVGEALARYKVPAIVDVVDQLPRNAVGKVLKSEL
jgi:acyl-CoA synthetase (AMP-forming)/AMP-acid ligase II